MSLDKPDPNDEAILSILLRQLDGTTSVNLSDTPHSPHSLDEDGARKLEMLRRAIDELNFVKSSVKDSPQPAANLENESLETREITESLPIADIS